MARSLNKVQLIGNLTRDPELRYTPQGTAVCTFGLATNRQWSTDTGEKKEDVEFHRIVAWRKLAELCGQLLSKGRKAYVEGRLQTNKWKGQDEVERTTTEIVIHEMIILDSRGAQGGDDSVDFDVPEDDMDSVDSDDSEGKDEAKSKGDKTKKKEESSSKKKTKSTKNTKSKKGKSKSKDEKDDDDDSDDDIPF